MPSLRPSLLSFLRSRPLRTPRFVTCPRSLSSATKTTTQGDGRRRLLVNAGVGFVGGIGVVLFMGWRNNVVEGFEGKVITSIIPHSPAWEMITIAGHTLVLLLTLPDRLRYHRSVHRPVQSSANLPPPMILFIIGHRRKENKSSNERKGLERGNLRVRGKEKDMSLEEVERRLMTPG